MTAQDSMPPMTTDDAQGGCRLGPALGWATNNRMTKEECIIKACQVIRKRVRFDGASIALPTTPFPGDDTPAIREATRRYVETWIVPLLDSIESGDMTRIKQYYEFERGHEMESPNTKSSD